MRPVALGDPLDPSRLDHMWIMRALREIELASHEEFWPLDTDSTLGGNDDDRLSSQKATKTYVDGVVKTADQTRNTTTTLADDSTLKFSVAANSKYRFRIEVFYDTPTTADFKWQLTGPSAPTLIVYDGFALPPGATALTITRDNAFSSPHSLTETSGTIGKLVIEGILHNGANAGTLAFQWAQNTSDVSNTTVRAGSWISWRKIA